MSDLKTTQGNWRLLSERDTEDANWDYAPAEEDASSFIIVADEDDWNWCLGVVLNDGPNGYANGSLWAASRDLYESTTNLLSLVRALSGPDDDIANAAIAQAVAALAKARGQK